MFYVCFAIALKRLNLDVELFPLSFKLKCSLKKYTSCSSDVCDAKFITTNHK